jgi:hypothetical protein
VKPKFLGPISIVKYLILLTFEDMTESLSRNVGKKWPLRSTYKTGDHRTLRQKTRGVFKLKLIKRKEN